MKMEHPEGAGIPGTQLPFSPVVRVGELLFVSGQASVDEQGVIVEDQFEEEVRRSFRNLKAVLEGAGSDLEHVVQTRNYVRDGGRMKQFNEIYLEFFKAPYPARTTLTGCLGRIQFEVDCIALVKES